MNREKKRKMKKHRDRKRKAESSDSSSNEEWVEAKPQEHKRDDWMDTSLVSAFATAKDYKAQKKQRELSKAPRRTDAPGMHERELNPYWKDGGTGLPQEEQPKELAAVGDCGLKWLKRAYKRMQEQAQQEGRSLEDIAAQRYGSLEKLQSMIRDAEQRCGNTGRSWRSQEEQSRTIAVDQKSSASTSRFLRPSDEDGDHRDSKRVHRERWRKQNLKEKPRSNILEMPSEERGDNCRLQHNHEPSWMKKEQQKEAKETRMEPVEPPKLAEQSNEVTTNLLSDVEMNALGARLIKAELLGNIALYNKLKKEMEAARTASAVGGQERKKEEVVILTRTDHRGMTYPLAGPVPEKKKIKAQTHDRHGKRVSYFADDDRFSLREMFQREKGTTAKDQNLEFACLAGKVKASREDLDDVATDAAARFDTSAMQDNRNRAIAEHKKMTKSLEKCKYCLDSPEMKKHLIVAIGLKTYLCLPPYESLTEGHCLIVPQQHVASGTLVDEDVWLEIQIFRKGLSKMFENMERDAVFMETAMGFRHHPHAVLECVPVPKDVGNLVPMYFKKAILESETEWAQNKKLVELSEKGLRNSIPKGLPYFSVDFGLQSGFAHVIEDEEEFPRYFGKEILGGMLDLEPRLWKRMQYQKFDDQRKKVLQFAEWWKPYDWTERVKSELKDL